MCRGKEGGITIWKIKGYMSQSLVFSSSSMESELCMCKLGNQTDNRGIVLRGSGLHRKYKCLSVSEHFNDKLWSSVRKEKFSTVFDKHWVARNCRDAENTRLGEVRGRGLDTHVHLSAEGTSCVGKVRLHLLEAVGYLTFWKS